MIDIYKANSYDEAIEFNGEIKNPYKKFLNFFNDHNYKDLYQKKKFAHNFLKKTGITFNLNSFDENDRLIPFDIIPRIINKKDWKKIKKGIVQRVITINSFLKDIYNNQEIIKAGILPLSLIRGNNAFLPQMLGFIPPHGIYNHISGIDLIKTNSSDFFVLEDNVRVPSGVSYMIKNRQIMLNLFPEIFSKYQVLDTTTYPKLLSEYLSKSCVSNSLNQRIVVLTPGINNSAFFEHSFLADQMGAELVQGGDLSVRDSYLNMRTTEGWKRVNILYRRIDDEYLDPLSLREDSLLGVPGIIDVYKKGNVTIANAPGCGIADDKAIYSFIPDMIKFYLGEKPILKNVITYRCSNKDDFKFVINNIDELVVKEIHGSGGYGMLVGPLASKKDLNNFIKKITRFPDNYIAQPTMSLSTCPTFVSKGIAPRHVDLRPFAILSKDDIYVSPGGLTRVALKENSLVVNSSQGGGTKDTWIL